MTQPSTSTALIAHLPSELPVMVLSDCFLFPGCYLPLFIFEERYRQMLADALATDRMFCIGSRCGREGSESETIVQVSCAGMIRACVQQEDGTSHLMLMGVQRVRFTAWQKPAPYCVASIEPILSVRGDEGELRALCDEALKLLPSCPSEAASAMAALLDQLNDEADHELICDILTYNFIHCPSVLSASLAEAYVPRRFELLIAELRRLRA